jgi:hypothetical protein
MAYELIIDLTRSLMTAPQQVSRGFIENQGRSSVARVRGGFGPHSYTTP